MVAMELSPKGLDFLLGWEGRKSRSSPDQGGRLDIGYGHLLTLEERVSGEISVGGGRMVYWTDGVTEHEARLILQADVARFEKLVNRLMDDVELDQQRFDALVILAFNIGEGNFRSSTLVRRLRCGDVPGALDAWAWFNKVTQDGKKVVSRGLVKRREAEIAIFRDGDYSGRP